MIRTGQTTVSNAGTAVAVSSVRYSSFGDFLIKAHPGNTGPIWLGNDGGNDVTINNGLPFGPGEGCHLKEQSLQELFVDAEHNGDTVCWLRTG